MNCYVKTDEDVMRELRSQVASLIKERDEANGAFLELSQILEACQHRCHSLEEGVRCAVEALNTVTIWDDDPRSITAETMLVTCYNALTTLKPLIKERP